MNSEQFWGMLKPVVAGIAGYLAGKHILFDSETWNIILTSVATMGSAAWSYKNHTPAAIVASAAALPEVKNIVVTPALAATSTAFEVSSTDNTKVVAK